MEQIAPAIIAAVLAAWLAALVLLPRRESRGMRVAARDFAYPLLAAGLLVLWWLRDPATPFGRFIALYATFALVIAVFVTLVWALSLALRDSSIMDIAYPLVAAIPAAVTVLRRGSWSAHEVIVLALVALWSLRLAGHIGRRNLGHGEDRRYARWRETVGSIWWWWSYFQVFLLQGVLVAAWCLPLALALEAAPAGLGWPHVLALLVFAIGFVFQAGGDWQLERFRKIRADKREVLDTGLWSLSRHPNYFGEAAIWWAFWALSLVHPWGLLAIVAPIHVTWFMLRGSATPMQERYLAKTKPAYADYIRRVPLFFPWGGAK